MCTAKTSWVIQDHPPRIQKGGGKKRPWREKGPGQAESGRSYSFIRSFIHLFIPGNLNPRNGNSPTPERTGTSQVPGRGTRSQKAGPPHTHHSGLPLSSGPESPARVQPPIPAVAMETRSPGRATRSHALIVINSPEPHPQLAALTSPRDTDPGLSGRRFKDPGGTEPTPTPSAAAQARPLEPRRLSSALPEKPATDWLLQGYVPRPPRTRLAQMYSAPGRAKPDSGATIESRGASAPRRGAACSPPPDPTHSPRTLAVPGRVKNQVQSGGCPSGCPSTDAEARMRGGSAMPGATRGKLLPSFRVLQCALGRRGRPSVEDTIRIFLTRSVKPTRGRWVSANITPRTGKFCKAPP